MLLLGGRRNGVEGKGGGRLVGLTRSPSVLERRVSSLAAVSRVGLLESGDLHRFDARKVF
jgi:hypothetical protein